MCHLILELVEEFGSSEEMCVGRPEDGGVEDFTYSPALSKMQREEARWLGGAFAEQFLARPAILLSPFTFTGDEPLVAERAHGVIQTQRQAIERELEEIATGIIRPSESAWVSHMMLANKPNGKIQFYVDYWRCNKITRPYWYPMYR